MKQLSYVILKEIQNGGVPKGKTTYALTYISQTGQSKGVLLHEIVMREIRTTGYILYDSAYNETRTLYALF
jgi:hypothetical protein